MAIVIENVDIKGLRKAHFKQLLTYIKERELEGWYYGNKKYFDIRHEDLKKWVIKIIDLLESDDVLIPKN